MNTYWNDGTELYHFGILGMKWGQRRWQNPDGTFNEEGKRRYGRVGVSRDHKAQKRSDRITGYSTDSNGIKYKTITDKNDLDRLYSLSALSKEGINAASDADRRMLINALKRYGIDTSNVELNTISGKTMNSIYGLTGSNAYNDNFHILSITGIEHGPNTGAFRSDFGCRWFDDIVDNNARLELKRR